jgi:hypothetical protein
MEGTMTPGTLNLSVVAGDGYSHTVSFVDADGDPIDVSAYEHRAQLRTHHQATTATDFAIDETSAAAGSITLSLSAAQTRTLRVGVLVWDLERQADGAEPETILAGVFRVRPDVTREEVES